MTCESIDPLSMQLEAIQHVESVSAERRAHQLDVNYYATKMKGVYVKYHPLSLSFSSPPLISVFFFTNALQG